MKQIDCLLEAPQRHSRYFAGRLMGQSITRNGAVTAVVLVLSRGLRRCLVLGLVEGNFFTAVVLVALVTGIYWLAERLLLPQRRQAAWLWKPQVPSKADLSAQGIHQVDDNTHFAKARLFMQPWWLD
jgi:hypothetical protein